MNMIEDVLETKVRPSLREHDGDVKVLSYDEQGILKIKLLGRCSNCPSANLTNEELIEKELIEAIPQIKRVILVTGVSDDLINMAKSMLKNRNTK